MKSIIKIAIFNLVAASSALTANAQQTLNSAYFLDNFTYRHEMNPAFMGDTYVSIPIVGQLNISTRGNIGLENFLFRTEKQGLTTFMNPDISANRFLGELNKDNNLSFNMKTSVLSTGFYGFGGYNTIGINLHVNTGLNLPYDFFEFAKMGFQGNTQYNLKDLSVRAYSYAEVALGHSHKINENLTIGAKLKLLVGAAYLDANMEEMEIHLANNKWTIRSHAKVNIAMKGASFTQDSDGIVNGIDVESPGIGGLGFGMDLGANYKFNEGVLKGLSLSAAILDLGFINWSENSIAYNEGSDFEFDGFNDIAIDNDGEGRKLEDQIDDLTDDLEKLYNVYTNGETQTRKTTLASTLNLGASYALPCYNKLNFGLLYSKHFDDIFSWQETRISANINPTKWVGAGINYAFTSYGSSMGFVLNFHPTGFNFFIGTDYMLREVNSQFIPLDSNANISLGVNLILGKK